ATKASARPERAIRPAGSGTGAMLDRTSTELPPIGTTFNEYWLVDQFGVSVKKTVKFAGLKPVMEFAPATVRSGNCWLGVTLVPSPRSQRPSVIWIPVRFTGPSMTTI